MPKIFFTDNFSPNFGRDWCALPTDEEAAHFTDAELAKLLEEWEAMDLAARKNPVGDGWRLESWKEVFDNWRTYNIFCMLGGNASAKSTFGARLTLSIAAMIPEASVAAFSPSAETSIADQQKMVFEALPESLKNMSVTKGKHFNLNYSQKSGFTDGVLILPPLPGYRNGSVIRFYNYNQYYQNSDFIEGKRFHFFWGDEQMPLGLLDTIRLGRIGAYHGRGLLTYTVINSWNDTIEKILSKTETLKTRYCDHPKIRAKIPVLQKSLSMGSTLIQYVWSSDNPFCDYKEFLKLNASESKEVILARGFGIPTRLTTSAFPLFDRKVNVLRHEDLPWLKPKKLNARGQEVPYKITRYMAADPGGSKSWCILWAAVDASGTWFFYREYPEIAMGEWALPGNKPGPAQRGTGISTERYVEITQQVEEGEPIMERYIDPRMGNNERGGTTIVSELDGLGMVMTSAVVASSDVNKTEIQDGIQVINSLLHWNKDEPQSFTNAPKFYVSDRCENLIYCLTEYTSALGPGENTKDFIDVVRYLIKSNVGFVDETQKDENRTGVY